MRLASRIILRFRAVFGRPGAVAEDGLHVDTEMIRHRRELARSQNQAGHNLTVQTTIDMARTQTWTGG